MTRKELAGALSRKTREPLGRMCSYLDALEDVLTGELYRRGSVLIPGFGKAVIVDRAPRFGRNMKTGERVEIPARKSVKLKLSKSLKYLLALK
jgi:DNA-binding protein HU-beta